MRHHEYIHTVGFQWQIRCSTANHGSAGITDSRCGRTEVRIAVYLHHELMQDAALAEEIGVAKTADLGNVIAEKIGQRGIDELDLKIE